MQERRQGQGLHDVIISADGHGVQIGPLLGDYVVALALPPAAKRKAEEQ